MIAAQLLAIEYSAQFKTSLFFIKVQVYNQKYKNRMKSNIAISSVNKLTSTIKSTLQKGNSLIRSEIYNQSSNLPRNNHCKQIDSNHKLFPIGQEINAFALYQKVKPFTINNDKVKKNIINILNFAQIKWDQFCRISNKTGVHYNQYLQKFKVSFQLQEKIQHKLNTNLSYLVEDGNIQKINSIKIHFKRVIQYLSERARKYTDKNKQIINLMKKKDSQQAFQDYQEQAIKQEMLQILDKLKGQAINIRSDLKKDDVVIHQINKKQDRQMDVLSNKSQTLREMVKSQSLGFFKLLTYAGIGIAVWLFTLLFILIF